LTQEDQPKMCLLRGRVKKPDSFIGSSITQAKSWVGLFVCVKEMDRVARLESGLPTGGGKWVATMKVPKVISWKALRRKHRIIAKEVQPHNALGVCDCLCIGDGPLGSRKGAGSGLPIFPEKRDV